MHEQNKLIHHAHEPNAKKVHHHHELLSHQKTFQKIQKKKDGKMARAKQSNL
jgi:hypothetical protein